MARLQLILFLACFSITQIRSHDHAENDEDGDFFKSGIPRLFSTGTRRKLLDVSSSSDEDQNKGNKDNLSDELLSLENRLMLRMLISVLKAKNQFQKGYAKGNKGISEVVDSLATLIKDFANMFYDNDNTDSEERTESSLFWLI